MLFKDALTQAKMSRQLTARHSHRAWVSRGKLHVWGGCVEGQSQKFAMERHGIEVKRLTQVVEVFDVYGAREWTSVLTVVTCRISYCDH